MNERTNVILILTDQERAPGKFESAGMAAFRATQLVHHNRLASTGVTFAEHRIASSACVPSRASIFTGLSPWAHGIVQTDGFAKLADDGKMKWLAPAKAGGPRTMGHRFQAEGYETVYFGKWHLSHESHQGMQGDTPNPEGGLEPFGFNGWTGPEPHGADPRNSGLQRDVGYVRQAVAFLEERRHRILTKRTASSDADNCEAEKPFLLVVSLVNPHDIVFWPSWWIPQAILLAATSALLSSVWRYTAMDHKSVIASASGAPHVVSLFPSVLSCFQGLRRRFTRGLLRGAAAAVCVSVTARAALKALAVDMDGIYDPGPGPSDGDVPPPKKATGGKATPSIECASESPIVSEYRHHYPSAYGPRAFIAAIYRFHARSYRRNYLSLLRSADRHIGTILDAVDRLAESGGGISKTAVVLSSDHGELLGAHGGLHQKWYNAFEETIKVPLIVRAPWLHQPVEKERTGTRLGSGDGQAKPARLPQVLAPGVTVKGLLTSHLDLLPTLLGLSRGNVQNSQCCGGANTTSRSASRLDMLPGRDIFARLKGSSSSLSGIGGSRSSSSSDEDEQGNESYFVTLDHVLEGSSRHGSAGRRWPALGKFYQMSYPGVETSQTAVEALTAQIRTTTTTGSGCRATTVFKIVRTFDPRTVQQPAKRKQPKKQDEKCVTENESSEHICLFDLTADPAERVNLANDQRYQAVRIEMRARLAMARVRHGGPPVAADAEAAQALKLEK